MLSDGRLKDYQELFVNNIMDDILEVVIVCGEGDQDNIRAKLESRIETYDCERKEQLERDLPTAIARAMADVC